MNKFIWKLDCRYFKGDKPCKYKRVCDGCPHYESMGIRILIIKLAAIGDVMRTTPILAALKKKYAPCQITWVTDPMAYLLLKNADLIDRLLTLENPDTVSGLLSEKFDLLACLDKEPRATGLAMKVVAKEKIGFGLTEFGTTFPLSKSSEYAFQLGLDDELKFRINQKTYPEILFEIFNLPYSRQPYNIQFPESVITYSKTLAKLWKLPIPNSKSSSKKEIVIGLNTGSGTRFATKQWTKEGYIHLAELLYKKYGKSLKILLLGGPEEKQRNKDILLKLRTKRIPVIDTGCENSLLDFCSIIRLCDILVTGDTLAMHLGIALQKQLLVLMGSTCDQEIELYNRGEILTVDKKHFFCSPCYLSKCPQPVFCMETISAETVLDSLSRILKQI